MGRSQKYEAGYHDDSLYVVDCMFVQDTTCYFSLYASTLATNPISIAKGYRSGMDCETVTYTMHLDGSDSYVQEIDHVTADTIVSTRHKIQYYEWDFGDGQKSYQPVVDHVFQALPDKDTTYQVVLTTRYLTCEETDTLNLKLPALKYFTDTTIAYLCEADIKLQEKDIRGRERAILTTSFSTPLPFLLISLAIPFTSSHSESRTAIPSEL